LAKGAVGDLLLATCFIAPLRRGSGDLARSGWPRRRRPGDPAAPRQVATCYPPVHPLYRRFPAVLCDREWDRTFMSCLTANRRCFVLKFPVRSILSQFSSVW